MSTHRMKKKFQFLKLLLPIIVLFAILFPAIHSYEHIHNHTSSQKIAVKYHSDKSVFKVHDHANEECAICHFKISPVATFSFEPFVFYTSNSITSFVVFYTKAYSNFFKGSLFALRAPPVLQ